MRLRDGTIAGLLAALAAAPAHAQPADPIGALLDKAQAAQEEPDAAAESAPAETGQVLPSSAPPAAAAAAYESRVRASFASAQGFQGPLDGGWTLATAEGPLYGFQLVDKGTGVVEGAWRDLSRPGALQGSGFLDSVERTGSQLTLRFDGGARTAVLRPGAGGAWTGELTDPAGRRSVSLTRTSP